MGELRVHPEFQFGPRSVLVAGDRFRVTGGPVYVTDSGQEILMAERGVFVFRQFCVCGAAQWLEAFSESDRVHVVLAVGKSHRSRFVPNLRCRPYRVTGKVLGPVLKRRRRSVKKPSRGKK
jgi:hypothetical protein